MRDRAEGLVGEILEVLLRTPRTLVRLSSPLRCWEMGMACALARRGRGGAVYDAVNGMDITDSILRAGEVEEEPLGMGILADLD